MRPGTYAWVQEGNSKNLINVAVTRARKELIIIGNEEYILKKGGLLSELNLWSKRFV
jgi:superfamily I DNA and/or RNA helicase